MAWSEYSVDTIGDIKDKTRWAEANPALGSRIMLSTIEGESEQMPADTLTEMVRSVRSILMTAIALQVPAKTAIPQSLPIISTEESIHWHCSKAEKQKLL